MKRLTKFLYCLVGLILLAYAFASYYLLFWGAPPAWLPLMAQVYLLLAGCGVTIAVGFLSLHLHHADPAGVRAPCARDRVHAPSGQERREDHSPKS